jgi:glycosyltransferase involved in cell wall biosynthesis
MRDADADVYYQSPSSPFTGVVAWFAKRHGKCSIIRVASDLGCMRGKQLIRHWRDRKLYDYGLRNASWIAAQTNFQRALLEQHYGLPSEVVSMSVEIPIDTSPADKTIDVLWVGNLRAVKRPEVVIELARRLPIYNFTMVGGPLRGQDDYYEVFCRAAADVPNLTLLGALPYEEVGHFFDRARLHLNTSSVEGFPNTFLQAWVRRVPVVSFFDPDMLIEQRALGRKVSNVENMARAIEELLSDPVQFRVWRNAIWNYCRRRCPSDHRPASKVPRGMADNKRYPKRCGRERYGHRCGGAGALRTLVP